MIIEADKWNDISNEKSRTYHYPNGFKYVIASPIAVNIQKSSLGGHSHRVKTATSGHYIAPGWVAISWEAENGGFTF